MVLIQCFVLFDVLTSFLGDPQTLPEKANSVKQATRNPKLVSESLINLTEAITYCWVLEGVDLLGNFSENEYQFYIRGLEVVYCIFPTLSRDER